MKVIAFIFVVVSLIISFQYGNGLIEKHRLPSRVLNHYRYADHHSSSLSYVKVLKNRTCFQWKLQESSVSAPSPPSGSTELPLDFFDMINRCADRTVSCIQSGTMLIRIDYDTSVGDMTYTSLKNTIPMLKELVKLLAVQLELSVPPDFGKIKEVEQEETTPADDSESSFESSSESDPVVDIQEEAEPFEIHRSLRIFYPDMGEAVLARREWKLGKKDAEVPPCVFTSNIQNDVMGDTDRLAIILCPQYSETDYVQRILDMCSESNTPCIMINPALINMDQGFGARARSIKQNLLSKFTTTYFLRTLSEGALVREWPRGYTIWAEDSNVDGGYVEVKTYSSEPTREEINDQFDLRNDPKLREQREQANVIAAGVNEVVGFFKGLSRF